jgi:hypothetical protein
LSGVEVLSVHVPKTVGTAFRGVLESVYRADRVHMVYPKWINQRPTEVLEETWIADSLTLCRRTAGAPRAVHGHYLLTCYAETFPRAARIAWLRDPVDRIVSHYYWWRDPIHLGPSASPLERAVNERRLDLIEFARSPMMRDQVTSRFLGDPAGRGLTFIGIQERFDEDLERLRALMGWPAVRAPRANVNQNREYASRAVDHQMRAEIAALNPADTKLYEAVRSGSWRSS